eukprot:8611181-Lingulodinium_polyedra.AAC.1
MCCKECPTLVAVVFKRAFQAAFEGSSGGVFEECQRVFKRWPRGVKRGFQRAISKRPTGVQGPFA